MEIENLKLQKQIDELIDKIYPIGSYYETSDENFDPNVSWGGYWIKDTSGLVTVGASVNGTIGANLPISNQQVSGLSQVQLTIDTMPTHTHRAENFVYNPASSTGNKNQISVGSGTGVLAFDRNGDIDLKVNPEGGDEPHINYQPSIGVIRWHRVNPCIYGKFSWVPSDNYVQSHEGNIEYFNDITAAKSYISDYSAYEIKLGAIGKEITTIYSLFESNQPLLRKVDLSELDTSNVISTSRLFYNCTQLEEINIGTNDFSNVEVTTEMFYGVPSNCVILVKDQTTKDWLLSIRSDLTGIQIQ